MSIIYKVTKMSVVVTATMVLAGCSSFSNQGYQGGDHRGGGPAAGYGVPHTSVEKDARPLSPSASKKIPTHTDAPRAGTLHDTVTTQPATDDDQGRLLEGSSSAPDSSVQKGTEQDSDTPYTGGDHRGGGPHGPLG